MVLDMNFNTMVNKLGKIIKVLIEIKGNEVYLNYIMNSIKSLFIRRRISVRDDPLAHNKVF